MSANSETIYIKAEQNVLVYDRKVTLSDVVSITSSNEAMVRQIKQKKLYTFPSEENKKLPRIQRKIFSILKIVQLIHEDYPNAEISNEGESDFIVEYSDRPEASKVVSALKTALLCVIIFFGAGFTIMAFNNDIAVSDVFGKFYYQVTGLKSNGMTEIEISYCLGLPIGIILFFNHFGKKKLTPDPTPIQIELRKYEKDVDTTFVENSGREGKEEDVN